MTDNTLFDYQEGMETNLPTQQEVLQNEDQLLVGFLEAAEFKENTDFQRKIEIKRNGKLLFSFYIRPLTEEEVQGCRKRATKRRPDPRGKQFGMIEIETDWSNRTLKEKLNVIEDVDVIDKVLMGGEKDYINDVIDEISGYGMHEVSLEETAKN